MCREQPAYHDVVQMFRQAGMFLENVAAHHTMRRTRNVYHRNSSFAASCPVLWLSRIAVRALPMLSETFAAPRSPHYDSWHGALQVHARPESYSPAGLFPCEARG